MAMQTYTTPGGRRVLALEPGERRPGQTAPNSRQAGETLAQFSQRSRREYPTIVMRRRGEFYYQVEPETSDKRPRDPQTGNLVPRGDTRARAHRESRGETERHGARPRDPDPQREKLIQTAERRRRRPR